MAHSIALWTAILQQRAYQWHAPSAEQSWRPHLTRESSTQSGLIRAADEWAVKALGPGRLTYQGMEVNSQSHLLLSIVSSPDHPEAWLQHSDKGRAHVRAHRCKDSTSSSICLFSGSSTPPYTLSLASETKQLLLPKWTINSRPHMLKNITSRASRNLYWTDWWRTASAKANFWRLEEVFHYSDMYIWIQNNLRIKNYKVKMTPLKENFKVLITDPKEMEIYGLVRQKI